MRRIHVVVAAAAMRAGAALPVPAQARYGLLLREGADTVAVERVVRDGSVLRAEVLVPRRARLVVTARQDSLGCVRDARSQVFPWGTNLGGTPIQDVRVRLDGDSLRVEAEGRGATQRIARRAPTARFVMNGEAVAAALLVLECARGLRGDSADVPTIYFPNLRGFTTRLRPRGDSLLVVASESSWVWRDAAGQPSRVRIGELEVTRLEARSLDAIAFAAPDYSAPPDAPYAADAVTVIASDGARLAGTLTMPATAGRHPGRPRRRLPALRPARRRAAARRRARDHRRMGRAARVRRRAVALIGGAHGSAISERCRRTPTA